MERGSAVASCCAEHPDAEALAAFAAPWRVGQAIVSSTRGELPGLVGALRRRFDRVVEIGRAHV